MAVAHVIGEVQKLVVLKQLALSQAIVVILYLKSLFINIRDLALIFLGVHVVVDNLLHVVIELVEVGVVHVLYDVIGGIVKVALLFITDIQHLFKVEPIGLGVKAQLLVHIIVVEVRVVFS